MDSYIKHIRKFSDTYHGENQIIQNFIKRYGTIIQKFAEECVRNSELLGAIPDCNQKKQIITPGIPGFVKNSITQVDHAMIRICDIGENINTKVLPVINDFVTKKQPSTDINFDDALEKLQVEGKAIVETLGSKFKKSVNTDLMKKMDAHLSKMLKGKANDKQIKKLAELHHQVIEERIKLQPKRQEILDGVRDSLKECIRRIQIIADAIRWRNSQVQEIFNTFGITYVEMSAAIQTEITELRSVMLSLDFQDDMSKYCESRNMFRYDLDVPDFEVYDCDFDEDPLPEEQVSDFPIGMGDIVCDFAAGASPEMSCKKGRKLLLMEEPTEPWCCVMHPYTLEIGFIPNYCVKQTSFSMAVVLNEITLPNSHITGITQIKKGDFLGVLENQEEKCKVETIQGETGVISKDLIGIIY